MAYLRKRGDAWYYTITDADGRKIQRRGCSTKEATAAMAAQAEDKAAKIREGLVDPRESARVEASRESLFDHLNDYRENLLAKGNTPKHVELKTGRARRLAALTRGASLDSIDTPKNATAVERQAIEDSIDRTLKAARLADLTSVRVQSALASLKAAGRSLQSVNHYRDAIRGFAGWLWKSGRTSENILVGVTGFNPQEDKRHDRRTLSIDELRLLIATASTGPDYRRMTGTARALVYRLAATSGLRYNELRSLTPRSCDLEGNPPRLTLHAADSKNRKAATVTLAPDVAADLARWNASIDLDEPIFALPEKGFLMLKFDLERAGIPYRDESDQFFDFHSLRCQHASLLDAAGVPTRTIQTMMRHSDQRLTTRYIRPRLADIANAVEAIPGLRPAAEPPSIDAPASNRSTGTDGKSPSR